MHDQASITLTLARGKLRKRQDIGVTIAVHVCDGNVSRYPQREKPVGTAPATTAASAGAEQHHREGRSNPRKDAPPHVTLSVPRSGLMRACTRHLGPKPIL
jgi:hypothetical protein